MSTRKVVWLYVFISLIVLFSTRMEASSDQPDGRTPQRALGGNPPPLDSTTELTFPDEISICGEKLPLHDREVWERMDREFTIAVWDRAQVYMWLKRAGRYFPYIEKELGKARLPDDLKYLAVAESALIPQIKSNAGALGSWQFMPYTGRRHGLTKNHLVDERRDFEQSTHAAISYISDLKSMFGKWTLAMAAYNCGENRLKSEIELQKTGDYFRLILPKETERYVFRIASAKIIIENHEKYGYFIPAERIYKPIDYEKRKIQVKAPIPIADLAAMLDTDFRGLKSLNPQFKGYTLPTGVYEVKAPPGKGDDLEKYAKRLSKSAQKKQYAKNVYVVRPGDNLTLISKKTGVSISRLKKLNNIKGSLIMAGQRLRLRP